MKRNPQVKLRKHLQAGRLDLAAKDIKEGASLLADTATMTAAEKEMVYQARVDLWQAAVLAPSVISVKWLVEQDPTFAEVIHALDPRAQASQSNLVSDHLWGHLVGRGASDTLVWAAKHLVPQAPPFSQNRLTDMLNGALNRVDAVGLAWLAHEGFTCDHMWRNPAHPLLWSVVNNHMSTWSHHPENLVARLEVLVPLGFTAEAPPNTLVSSALGPMLDHYASMQGSSQKSQVAALDRHLPRAWDLLVQAGADPQALDSTGTPLWHRVAGTPLGDRYAAELRAARASDQEQDPVTRVRPRRARP